MRFAVHYNACAYSYYVLDNNDGAIVSCRLPYDKAVILAQFLNREDSNDA